MTTLCTICARGGSVGVPRKNVRPLLGKPLIAWTIEQAIASPSIDVVAVSTDDDEIADVARRFGADVPFRRPAALADSNAAKIPVIEHLVSELERAGRSFDRIVDLDPTSPLRLQSDIEGAIALLDDSTDAVITGYRSDKNPYFNMVERKADGNIDLVMSGTGVVTRQSAPTVWAMNASIYVWHRTTLSAGLWGGRTQLYEMPHERSVDIDAELDFQIVERLMEERQE